MPKTITLLFAFAFLLLTLPIGAREVTALKQHYCNTIEVRAKIEQIKESDLFITPIKSKIDLVFKDQIVFWSVKTPVPFQMKILPKGIYLKKDEHSSYEAITTNKKLAAIAGFIRTLMSAEFEKLERDFNLVFTNSGGTITHLKATPKEGVNLAFISQIIIIFHKNLNIKSLTITTAKEQTTLFFKEFELIKEKRDQSQDDE